MRLWGASVSGWRTCASVGVRLWGCVGDCAQELKVFRATYGVMFDCYILLN